MWDNGRVMFLVRCEIVGRVALVWPSDLISLTNTESGIVVRYRCVCGQEAETPTGARSRGDRHVHLGSAA
jgi:hypothetical protein